jgi:hypothetical protein
VVVGKPRAVTRLLAAPPPPPPQLPPPPQAAVAKAERGVAVVPAAEVSLAEELERARGRRGRLREARERAEVEMDGRAEALDREAAEWARRAGEQRRLVAELMRLIGTPEVSKAKVGRPSSSSPSLHPSVRPMYLFFWQESIFDGSEMHKFWLQVYTPVESLRSREERKRREAVAHSSPRVVRLAFFLQQSTTSIPPPRPSLPKCSCHPRSSLFFAHLLQGSRLRRNPVVVWKPEGKSDERGGGSN